MCRSSEKFLDINFFSLHLHVKDCDDENLEKISKFGHETMQLSG